MLDASMTEGRRLSSRVDVLALVTVRLGRASAAWFYMPALYKTSNLSSESCICNLGKRAVLAGKMRIQWSDHTLFKF